MADKQIKTILVIGNGFDLAHGLKTKYTDFLDFIIKKKDEDIDRAVNKSVNRHAQGKSNQNQIKQNLRDFYKKHLVDSRKKISRTRLMSHVQRSLKSGFLLHARIFTYIFTFNNIWINYFRIVREDKRKQIGDDWVDFESEIEYSVKMLEKFFLGEQIDVTELQYIINKYPFPQPRVIIQNHIPWLEWDLKMLSLTLEIYLSHEENSTLCKPLNLIKNLPEVYAVISYNYTNTWQKIYGEVFADAHLYFIHGQLGEHNLVLGTGETLPPELESSHTECASFKKFFQRVKYCLGNGYHITDSNRETEWQIVIYGHSLDPTDKESLCWLLGEDKNHKINLSKVIVYYYDEKSYNQQIANAIQIIGKETLINNVHSGKLIFEPIPK